MKKALIQLVLIVLPYTVLYLALERISLYERLNLRAQIDAQKKSISDKLWSWQGFSDREITDPEIKEPVLRISKQLLRTRHPDVSVHIVYASDINAYTLPGNHIVLTTGLILNSKSPEELSAVIAHELGHVLGHHVSKNIAKEVLIYAVQRVTGEEIGTLIFKSTLENVSSLAYQRELEKEADQLASQLLASSSIDPIHLGTFLERNAQKNAAGWMSTHPNPEHRIELIKSARKSASYSTGKILTESEWTVFRNLVKEAQN